MCHFHRQLIRDHHPIILIIIRTIQHLHLMLCVNHVSISKRQKTKRRAFRFFFFSSKFYSCTNAITIDTSIIGIIFVRTKYILGSILILIFKMTCRYMQKNIIIPNEYLLFVSFFSSLSVLFRLILFFFSSFVLFFFFFLCL